MVLMKVEEERPTSAAGSGSGSGFLPHRRLAPAGLVPKQLLDCDPSQPFTDHRFALRMLHTDLVFDLFTIKLPEALACRHFLSHRIWSQSDWTPSNRDSLCLAKPKPPAD